MTFFVFIDETGKASDIEKALLEGTDAKYILVSAMMSNNNIKGYSDLVRDFISHRVEPLLGTANVEIHGNEMLSIKDKESVWTKIPIDERIRLFKDLFTDVIGNMKEMVLHIVGMHSSAIEIHKKEFSLDPLGHSLSCDDILAYLQGRGLLKYYVHRRKKVIKKDLHHCINTSLLRVLLERIQYSFQKKSDSNSPVVLVLDSHPNEDGKGKTKIRMPASEEDLRMLAALEDARMKSVQRNRWSGPLYASLKSSKDEPLLQIVDVIAYVINRIENNRPTMKGKHEKIDFWKIFDKHIKPKIRPCPSGKGYCSNFCECGYKFIPRECSEVYKRFCKGCLPPPQMHQGC